MEKSLEPPENRKQASVNLGEREEQGSMARELGRGHPSSTLQSGVGDIIRVQQEATEQE